jgi:hypothetical protein
MAPTDQKQQFGYVNNQDYAHADAIAAQLVGSAQRDDEQLRAFQRAFTDNVALPSDACVIGEPVAVVQIDYDGNIRRGLTAACRRADDSRHVVALCDVLFPQASTGARYLADYRKWLGLDAQASPEHATPPRARHKVGPDDIDLARPIEVIVLAVKQSSARCRVLGTQKEITVRSMRAPLLVPGEIATVRGGKQWRHAGHPYLSGDITGHRFDVAALGLVPLRIEERGMWEPARHYWGEEDEPLEDWAKPIVARGPRPSFEMEQVFPGEHRHGEETDPILQAIERHDSGDLLGAAGILMKMLAADLRCLDAHAHLGNFIFDDCPAEALRHYEVGVRIGELSLGHGFDGVLPWGHIDNRPFLRCLRGYGAVPLAGGPCRGGRRTLRANAVAQPYRQPGHTRPATERSRRWTLGGLR